MATCELCGEPMPAGEEMFKYHGYSGPCPKPPKHKQPIQHASDCAIHDGPAMVAGDCTCGADINAFYAAHIANGPNHVVLVTIFFGANEDTHIFSSLEKAQTWADKQAGTALFSTRVIDVPEYGNVPKGEQN